MNALFTLSRLVAFLVPLAPLVPAFYLNRRFRRASPGMKSFFWGYYFGVGVIAVAVVLLITIGWQAFSTRPASQRIPMRLFLLPTVPPMLLLGGLGVFVLMRHRWAFIGATLSVMVGGLIIWEAPVSNSVNALIQNAVGFGALAVALGIPIVNTVYMAKRWREDRVIAKHVETPDSDVSAGDNQSAHERVFLNNLAKASVVAVGIIGGLAALCGIFCNLSALATATAGGYADLIKREGIPYFYAVVYVTSIVCIVCYVLLILCSADFIRLRFRRFPLFVATLCCEVMYLVGTGLLWMSTNLGKSVAVANGAVDDGLMFQFIILFPFWAPLVVLWARRRLRRNSPSV